MTKEDILNKLKQDKEHSHNKLDYLAQKISEIMDNVDYKVVKEYLLKEYDLECNVYLYIINLIRDIENEK